MLRKPGFVRLRGVFLVVDFGGEGSTALVIACLVSVVIRESSQEASAITRGTIQDTELGSQLVVESLMHEQGRTRSDAAI